MTRSGVSNRRWIPVFVLKIKWCSVEARWPSGLFAHLSVRALPQPRSQSPLSGNEVGPGRGHRAVFLGKTLQPCHGLASQPVGEGRRGLLVATW